MGTPKIKAERVADNISYLSPKTINTSGLIFFKQCENFFKNFEKDNATDNKFLFL